MKIYSFISRLSPVNQKTAPTHSADELEAKAAYIAARNLWLRREAAVQKWAMSDAHDGYMTSWKEQVWKTRACGWLKKAESDMKTARIAYERAMREV